MGARPWSHSANPLLAVRCGQAGTAGPIGLLASARTAVILGMAAVPPCPNVDKRGIMAQTQNQELGTRQEHPNMREDKL